MSKQRRFGTFSFTTHHKPRCASLSLCAGRGQQIGNVASCPLNCPAWDGLSFQFEKRAQLARFEGSSSISSADYFGGGQGGSQGSSQMGASGPNLYEIREGVRDGVTKVASRLSSLASGVMNSLQVSAVKPPCNEIRNVTNRFQILNSGFLRYHKLQV